MGVLKMVIFNFLSSPVITPKSFVRHWLKRFLVLHESAYLACKDSNATQRIAQESANYDLLILWLNTRMGLKPPAPSSPEKKANIFWPAAIFLVVFFVYVICPVTTSTDSRWTFYFSMSMLREGNADLDEYAHLMEDRDFRVLYLDGHIYSYFPLAVPIVSVPYVWAVDQVFDLRYAGDLQTYLLGHFPDHRLAKIEKVYASFIAALTTVLFFLTVSPRLSRLRAALLAFAFAFLTPMLSTASRALWQHGLSALCLTLVLWILLQHPQKQEKWKLFLVGFLLGFSYVVRPTNSISVAIFSLYILINYRKKLFVYLTGLLIPLFTLAAHSLLTFHSILPPYYLPQRLGANSNFFNAFWGNIISPNRGLFTTTPIFLFSIFGIYLLMKNRRMTLKNIELYLALILLAHWITISSFDNWYGGWSLGPRFFTDMTPYLAFFLIPVFEGIHLSSRFLKIVFAMSLLLSGLIHFRYVTSIYPMMWNGKPTAIVHAPERVWSLLDLQVFRGTCEDQLEGRAPLCWFYPGE